MPAAAAPSLPWLDCTGPGFEAAWDLLYFSLAAGPEAAEVGEGVLRTSAAPEDFLRRTWQHHRVAAGVEDPARTEGHCHLGFVLLRHVRAQVLQRHDAGAAAREREEARRLLLEPLGVPVAFTFLESSRWGKYLNISALLQSAWQASRSAADVPLPVALPTVPLQQYLALMTPRGTMPARLVFAAMSTHASVVEPVASLREVLQKQHGSSLHVEFLGLVHPEPHAACEALPDDSLCSEVSADVLAVFQGLADLQQDTFQEAGFISRILDFLSGIYSHQIAGRVDAIVCGHPFLLCALLRMLGDLPLLVYLTEVPLALVPEESRAWVLGQLRALALHGATRLLASSRLYALEVWHQAGVLLEAARPSALHVAWRFRWRGPGARRGSPGADEPGGEVYVWGLAGVSSDFSVMCLRFLKRARELGAPWLGGSTRFTFKDLAQDHASWSSLELVRCVVLLPWDLQLTVFSELYALGVPLVLPTAEFVASYGVQVLRARGSMFWAVNPRFAGVLPGPWTQDFTVQPWISTDNIEANDWQSAFMQFAYWYRASDFEAFGHTLRFSSIPDVLQVAAATPSADLRAASDSMQQEWLTARRQTELLYAHVVEALLPTSNLSVHRPWGSVETARAQTIAMF